MLETSPVNFDLIVTIVNKGFAEEVIDAARKSGAGGGTILNGREKDMHEKAKLLGIPFEPEKEIVLTIIDSTKTQKTLEAISETVGRDKPSKGVAFVMGVGKAVGIYNY